MPVDYRKTTSSIWSRYDLFEHTGMSARLGSSKDDISVLMTYVAIDKYLKNGGKLCIVITQTVFKTIGGGAGFRQFRLGKKGEKFKVLQVDDMSELQPFDSATNRTAVFLCQKGESTKYPVEYHLWKKTERGAINIDLTWNEVTSKTKIIYLKAQSIDGSVKGPWISARSKALRALTNVLGKSYYSARSGSCSWLNGVYWGEKLKYSDECDLFSNLKDTGKNKVKAVSLPIENSIIYPLIRGREVQKWAYSRRYFILVPQDRDTPSKAISLFRLEKDYPYSLAYFNNFYNLLIKRSGYLKYLQQNGEPFYSIYNVGEYSFAPFKVVWKEQSSDFQCVVISSYENKPVIPDHKLMMIPFYNEPEAHYVCAILNSIVTSFVVKSYTISTQQSTHILENIKIPQYDPQNETHIELSSLSKTCHIKTELGIDLNEIETQINALSAEIWGLTKEDIKEIVASYDAIR